MRVELRLPVLPEMLAGWAFDGGKGAKDNLNSWGVCADLESPCSPAALRHKDLLCVLVSSFFRSSS